MPPKISDPKERDVVKCNLCSKRFLDFRPGLCAHARSHSKFDDVDGENADAMFLKCFPASAGGLKWSIAAGEDRFFLLIRDVDFNFNVELAKNYKTRILSFIFV